MDYKDFEDTDLNSSQGIVFDFRGFLFKILNLWKFVLVCIGVALTIAYFINVRKQSIYKLDSLISIENDQNPFFTANTSISFNWGGVSGKVSKIITAIKTRSHNEKVVDSLRFYMEFLTQGKYRKEDIYKKAPFDFVINNNKPQLINYPIGIRFLGEDKFEIFSEFENQSGQGQIYKDKSFRDLDLPLGEFQKSYRSKETINLSFLSGELIVKSNAKINVGTEFFIRFLNIDFKKGIKILLK